MLRFLADEDFDNRIVRGLQRRLPMLDIIRVQDVGLRFAHDREILKFAADEDRVLLTQDVTTMVDYGKSRIAAGLHMPGVFEVPQSVPVGIAIDELFLIAQCSNKGEWSGQIRFLPIR